MNDSQMKTDGSISQETHMIKACGLTTACARPPIMRRLGVAFVAVVLDGGGG